MKSFCIKTNNNQIRNYLLNNFSSIDFDDIYYISRKFKIYENIIIHYTGKDINEFLGLLSTIITDCILIYYEPILIRRSINFNYFYFDDFEKKNIEEICYNYILIDEDNTLKFRKDEIWQIVLNYIIENKSMVLDGFVNFRLEDYLNTIDNIVDYSVNKYVVEKEYHEFINLLKQYIDSKENVVDLVHIIYTNGESILLDKDKNIIQFNDSIFDNKYLSDITFSSNDYTLNTLLNLNPKKIHIHLVDENIDEFINTIKLIFEERVDFCNNCEICKIYTEQIGTRKI